MRLAVRTLLLLLTALCLALPMAGGSSADSVAAATSTPCPSKVVLKACVPDGLADGVVPRGAAAIDGSCIGKAIDAYSSASAGPTACGAITFDIVAASWSSRSPSTPTPPPDF